MGKTSNSREIFIICSRQGEHRDNFQNYLSEQKEDEGIFREAILIVALCAQAAYADRMAFLKYLFLRQSKIITHARQGVPMLPGTMKT